MKLYEMTRQQLIDEMDTVDDPNVRGTVSRCFRSLHYRKSGITCGVLHQEPSDKELLRSLANYKLDKIVAEKRTNGHTSTT